MGVSAKGVHRPDAPWHDKAWLEQQVETYGNANAVADVFDTTRNTIAGAMRKYGVAAPLPNAAAKIPPLVAREDVFIELVGDALVISDLHIPVIRYDVLHDAIAKAKAAGITQCVIVGDLTNSDAMAGHDRKQPTAGMEVELPHLSTVMAILLEAFESVVVTRGNHDRHASRALKLGEAFDKALRLLLADVDPALIKRLRVSNKDKAYLDTDEGRWLLAHTYTYSRIAMSYPMKLAVRHHMHVAAAHRHHHGVCIAPNGKYAAELGGLFDAARMGYIHDWTNDLPEMVNGYLLIVGGRPRLPMLTG